MIPKSDRNSQGSSKESRSLLISADRRMVGCHPMANGHGSNEPETTRTEPKRTDTTEKPTSQREAMMAGGLQVPSKIDETQTKLTRKTKLKNDGCPWWRAWKRHSRKLTKTGWFRNHSSRVVTRGLRAPGALSRRFTRRDDSSSSGNRASRKNRRRRSAPGGRHLWMLRRRRPRRRAAASRRNDASHSSPQR